MAKFTKNNGRWLRELKILNIRNDNNHENFTKKNRLMEPLNIPFIADTTIRGGTFQTTILQFITYGQRDNSRLFELGLLITVYSFCEN